MFYSQCVEISPKSKIDPTKSWYGTYTGYEAISISKYVPFDVWSICMFYLRNLHFRSTQRKLTHMAS